MPVPKLLDVCLDEPTVCLTDADVQAVTVVGGTEAELVTHSIFLATAFATLLENHFAKTASQAWSTGHGSDVRDL
jgi:hypothetical protein